MPVSAREKAQDNNCWRVWALMGQLNGYPTDYHKRYLHFSVVGRS
ncbi:hypothetical protein LRLP16767_LR202_00716 [Limosilactobacillus reuteri]|uniref:Uncharacterized protein n=1 Tax=Limosilactobacillus reuteri TaxID=1598 RepID=A0A0U5JRX7_LIMRT|nr:hypothetical protein LRLP16767_LR202_00716 [Limosilactobacillus reuteri]